MIGSFWNFCRACPSMPEDKLHSEYRSTYRWHEYTGNNRAEVIKKPPATNQFASSADHFFSKSTEEERHVEGVINEPPLPRRKKCPELAYRTHEFITGETRTKNDINARTYNGRARSEERGTPSRRSKSEGPYRIPNGDAYPIGDTVDKPNGHPKTGSKAGESNGLFRKTISKLSTEYRIQFIWPHTRKDRKRGDDEIDIPKKSLSMGAIKAAQSNAMPTVHKKRTIYEKEASTQELEPLCAEEKIEKKSEFPAKKSVRPFSQYAYDSKFKHGHTERENFGFATDAENKIDNKTLVNGGHVAQTWYRDVVELRKKAEEYKNRGWGTEINPDLYKKQKDLWDQVSRRSSLSALHLASAVHKPITKEEKEAANNKKSSPIKNVSAKNVSQINFIDNKLIHDAALPARALYIRHHLGRTTGLDMEDGALLPSPTRDKLMPTIPKSKEDESYNSQRGSPKKSAISRHGSPQKGSPQKMQKKTIKQNRSQSVGPAPSNVDSSPKRQVRSGSAAPATTIAGTKVGKKTPVSTPTIVERRPRPTTLSTSNHYRSKSSSIPPIGRAHSTTPGSHQNQNFAPNNTHKLSSPSQNTIPVDPSNPNQRILSKTTTKQRPQSAIVMGTFDPMTASTIIFNDSQKVTNQDKKTARNEDDTDKDGVTSLSSASPIPAHEIYEHIVKSPPEPTRVKSPEQILMRSPDPVNWIVPLDTGKTFTVTQNIRNGDPVVRPQSEFKVSTPVDKPPSAPLSAPPNVIEQAKMEAWKNEKLEETLPIKEPPHPTIISAVPYDKPIPGSTLRRLDDPTFDTDITSSVTTVKDRPAATDDLNEARDRFDRFWGCNKDKDEKF
ncbi:uncharacterized protein LOC116345606 isoform X2 [Contarinia nasturtii]|uniref:uncharacterized protein LOC116345606 isoform X2 n=1 Tax=Contarinia nasturtii TaxID=265458 RepID=UPI0012D4260E|nr:uncharacterized protein LOC116345606 isoform X2 [Contarinia nasturtii]